MSHESAYGFMRGHARGGSPLAARLVRIQRRVRGWFASRAPEPYVEGRATIEREARSISVQALLEGRRWDAHL